jgi:hypothetical protein
MRRSYESSVLWEASPLTLFGSVFLVRAFFLIGEHALLLRVIAYYETVNAARVVPVESVGSLDSPEKVPLGTSTISFTDKVRDLFRGDRKSTWTTYALIISVFVQIVFWFSPDDHTYRTFRF